MSALNNYAGASVNGSGAIIATARAAFALDPSAGKTVFTVNTSDRKLDGITLVNVNATRMPLGPPLWMNIASAIAHGYLDLNGSTLVELNVATTPTRVNP